MTLLGQDFLRALMRADELHANDVRKGTTIPYITHPLAVASIVLERGGEERHALAALLHDVVEDHPDRVTIDDLANEFGQSVAAIVQTCSDSTSIPKPPWCPRKVRFIERLSLADDDALLVAFADKLHNAQSILADVRRQGMGYLDRFTAKKEGALWYFRALVEMFRGREMEVSELDYIVAVLETNAGERFTQPPCLDPCRFE